VKTSFVVSLLAASAVFGVTIDISTGIGNANWQVSGPGVAGTVAATSLSTIDSLWALAPIGTSWVSWGAVQGTPCSPATNLGSSCASALFNSAGDVWTYSLNVSAAQLGATSGELHFVFGADDFLTLTVGNETPETWGSSSTAGDNPLGCVGTPPASAGNTQASYAGCTNVIFFSAANLNIDGSLTLIAAVTNAPVPGCSGCSDPTGFVLDGDIVTGPGVIPSVPEPGTFGLIGAVGAVLLFQCRRRANLYPAFERSGFRPSFPGSVSPGETAGERR
jgi:hypothetical protein